MKRKLLVLIVLLLSKNLYSTNDQPEHCGKIYFSQKYLDEFTLEENRYKNTNMDSLEALLCVAKKIKNKKLEAAVLLAKSDLSFEFLSNTSQLSETFQLLDRSIVISQENNFDEILFWANERYCSIFTSNYLFPQAEVFANKNIVLANKMNDSVRVAESFMLKGRLEREKGYFKEAEKYFIRAIDYSKLRFNPRVLAYTYLHYSHLKNHLKQYKEALNLAEKGLLTANDPKNKDKLLLNTLAIEAITANINLNQFENERFFKFMDIKVPGDQSWLLIQKNILNGDIAKKQNNPKLAAEYYFTALNYAEKINSSFDVLTIGEKLLPLYEKGIDNSNKIEVLYKALQNAINFSRQYSANNKTIKYYFLELENEVSKTKLLESELRYSQRLSLALVLGLFLMTIIGFLIYKQFRNNKLYAETLNKLNIGLNETVKELSVKTDDLNHSNLKLKDFIKTKENVIERLQKFASVLIHDIKQPVISINNFVNLINKSPKISIDEQTQSYLDNIYSSALRVKEITDRLSNYSNNTLLIFRELEKLDLNDILESVLLDLNDLIREKNAIIKVGPLQSIDGDDILIYQLFQNLISNSLKFSRNNVQPLISIENEIEGKNLLVKVVDNGVGIQNSPSFDLFQLFRKGDNSESGYGIGLALSKEIVEIHGGDIWYESELNTGTTFYVRFKKLHKKDHLVHK